MAGPLIETKLFAPQRRRELAPRPRLRERLDRGARAKLTLVAAPAGFGKTTLLTEWLAATPAGEGSVAWLSLDQTDNHPSAFWTYLIAALQTVAPGVGVSARSHLQAPQPPPTEAILATLLNELSASPNEIVLVLDDYHLVDAHEIHEGMTFLIDHLPPRLHLVIASRTDPPLPLARLRVRGELAEIRAADLRFTPNEATAYLNEVMGLDLTAANVEALEVRTEGWIAALQLAALSVQGRDDAEDFIAGFSGDDRYVVDYLVEEVLQRQPERVRRFLLQTSILSRLSGPLCDTVTGESDGKAMLESLERANLFLVPLDGRRRWYRYHHLFADMLQTRLLDERPDDAPDLHRRASAWYERNGETTEAIRHALAGEDLVNVADLVEQTAPALFRSRHEAMVLDWLRAIPDELLRDRPVLCDFYAGALLSNGRFEEGDARLRDAERWLRTVDEGGRAGAVVAGMVVVDEAGFHRLAGSVAVHRAGYALVHGNLAGAEEHARRALALAPQGDDLARGGAAGLLGLAAWTSGRLEEAYQSWEAAVASLRRAGHVADALGCTIALADIRVAQGRLSDAKRIFERALETTGEPGGLALRGTADMHVGLAEIHFKRGDLPAATEHLKRSRELGEHAELAQNPYRWRVVMAHLRQAEGDIDGALALLDEAERRYTGDFFPNVRPVAASRARIWVQQNRPDDALAWARERGLSAKDELDYLREFEHVTFARALVGQFSREGGSLAETIGHLERLLAAAEAGGRMGSAIEILVILALAHQARGDVSGALGPLTRALRLAEPESYVRIFVDEGPSMAALLEAAARRGILPNYTRRLLASFGNAGASLPVKQDLIEPLSERERDVLRLLRSDLNGPDIARELVVSLNTMRTHTKSIYEKLGVNSRRAAVRRAEELGLFAARPH
ncbi:MAG: LuxR C-terminal-related transcriptional regulator [Dehalococcoidia bacterium]